MRSFLGTSSISGDVINPEDAKRNVEAIDQQIASLNRDLQSFIAKLPASPLEAYEKADQILGIHNKLAMLLAQKNAIEDQLLNKGRQIESSAIQSLSAPEDLNAQIKSINVELGQLEDKLVEAEINGDTAEQSKINMMISSLRARRNDLIQRAKAANSSDSDRIAQLEAENRALREQLEAQRK